MRERRLVGQDAEGVPEEQEKGDFGRMSLKMTRQGEGTGGDNKGRRETGRGRFVLVRGQSGLGPRVVSVDDSQLSCQ
jgi:hypothetical protein